MLLASPVLSNLYFNSNIYIFLAVVNSVIYPRSIIISIIFNLPICFYYFQENTKMVVFAARMWPIINYAGFFTPGMHAHNSREISSSDNLNLCTHDYLLLSDAFYRRPCTCITVHFTVDPITSNAL